ncbi:hypothetical protein BRADI_2g10681v3 [Brachypodium distachyon]|uniref:Uncharacterized protein n=1 Tax=Brachypodium distachyon TaxID=15368 RepID=A0A2K2D7T0_BRADI|nr:hypothetical protein BRADI_2g10681v3 [Brachypodium distachyon]
MDTETKSTLIYIAVWAVVLSGMAILGHYLPDVEPEDERIKRVWRVPMAEYHSPSYVPKGMVSDWKVRNELSKKKWWMQDVKWPIGRKM